MGQYNPIASSPASGWQKQDKRDQFIFVVAAYHYGSENRTFATTNTLFLSTVIEREEAVFGQRPFTLFERVRPKTVHHNRGPTKSRAESLKTKVSSKDYCKIL